MATKTVLPGMSNDNLGANQFSARFSSASSGTVLPGMSQPVNSENEKASKPILGFLYSVSKTPFGEFWPLYLGQNTIGRSKNSSICLSEASVSENHATIVIRKMQHQGTNNGIFVFVQDTGSTCGTLLNGDTLDFSPRECKSGDVVTIGANYELYLIIVNPEDLHLAPKKEFQPIASESTGSPVSAFNPRDWAHNPVGMNAGGAPKGTVPEAQAMDQASQQSSNPFNSRKATIYMPQNNK